MLSLFLANLMLRRYAELLLARRDAIEAGLAVPARVGAPLAFLHERLGAYRSGSRVKREALESILAVGDTWATGAEAPDLGQRLRANLLLADRRDALESELAVPARVSALLANLHERLRAHRGTAESNRDANLVLLADADSDSARLSAPDDRHSVRRESSDGTGRSVHNRFLVLEIFNCVCDYVGDASDVSGEDARREEKDKSGHGEAEDGHDSFAERSAVLGLKTGQMESLNGFEGRI